MLPCWQRSNPFPRAWVCGLLVPRGPGRCSPFPSLLTAVLTSRDSVPCGSCIRQTLLPQREVQNTPTTPLFRGWPCLVELLLANKSCSSFPNARKSIRVTGTKGTPGPRLPDWVPRRGGPSSPSLGTLLCQCQPSALRRKQVVFIEPWEQNLLTS